jgi:hypothetical protein
MGFKLRSGNGPLQFKQMGASPVKQSEDFGETKSTTESLKQQKELNAFQKDAKNTKGTPEYAQEQKRIEKEKADAEAAKKQADADAKAKVDATRGTERGQKKKSGKLDKIQARQDKRAYKKYKKGLSTGSQGDMSLEQFKESDQYTDKSTRREERLKKEVDMTPEEYKSNQATKKQKFQDAMNRTAMILHPNFDPSQVAEFDEGVRRRGQAEETERINNEYKAAETKRIDNALDAYKKDQERQNELAANIPNATTPTGGPNTSTTETTKTE